MSIASSQQVFLNRGRLSDYGKSRVDYVRQMYSALDNVLKKYGAIVIDRATSNLDNSGAIATGKLRQSIIPLGIEVNGTLHRFIIEMPFYYKFVDKGRGKRMTNTPSVPPLKESIKQWIVAKGITWRPQGKETIQQVLDRQAFFIARKINRTGTKGNKFFSSIFTQKFIEDMTNEIAEVVGTQVVIQIMDK